MGQSYIDLIESVLAPRGVRAIVDPREKLLRILIVEPDLSENGALRVTLDRGARWGRSSEVVLLVTSPETQNSASSVEVPSSVAVRFGGNPKRRRAITLLTAVLRGLPLARKAEVVVAGREIGYGLIVAATIALIARRPLAVTIQSNVEAAMDAYLPTRQKYIVRRIYRHVQLAVCVSSGLVPSVAQLGVSSDRIEVVLNGLDAGRVRRLAKCEPAIDLPNRRFIVSVGRLVYQKGFDILIRAHSAALALGAPEHHVVIVGDGPARDELNKLAVELGVEDTIMFAGYVENPHAIIARAELYVSASRWEGFSLVVAEALSIGTPIIASDCVSGPSEILMDGMFGALVLNDHPTSLAQAILDHFKAPEILRSRSVAGSRGVAERFSPDRAADRHLGLLRELVEG